MFGRLTRQHTRQPRGVTLLDRSSRFNRNLVFHYAPKLPLRDMANGVYGTRSGPVRRPRRQELAETITGASTNYVEWASSTKYDLSANFTFVVRAMRLGTSSAAYDRVFHRNGDNTGNNRWGVLLTGSGDPTPDQLYFFFVDSGGTAKQTNGTGQPKLSTERFETWVYTYNGANLIAYRDGVQISSVAATGTMASSSRAVRFGDDLVGTIGRAAPVAVSMAHIVARAWSPAEVKDFSRNPWRVYKPQGRSVVWGVAAGGTTYNQSCSASSTPAAALIRGTGKPLAITSTAVATLLRSIGKPLTATQTGVATLVRQTNKPLTASTTSSAAVTATLAFLKSLTASSTPVATLVRAVGKIVSATSTPTGALTRQTGKPLSASTTDSATLIRSTAKSLTASSTSPATLAAIRAVLLSLTASSTGVATLRRQVGKPVTASSTAVSTAVKQTAKSLVATSTGAASLVKSIAKSLRATSTSLADLIATYLSGGVKVCTAAASDVRVITATATDARVITATASEAIA